MTDIFRCKKYRPKACDKWYGLDTLRLRRVDGIVFVVVAAAVMMNFRCPKILLPYALDNHVVR
jgi:hypothetical protein